MSDLLDFLDKKEEFKVYLQEKQQLRQKESEEKSSEVNDVVEPDNK